MTTSVARGAARRAPALSAYWPQFVPVAPVRSLPSRRRPLLTLSRNARSVGDWHTLLEFCSLVNSLIIDEDGVYDPKLINDRLLLGLKGTFSDLELSILRQRSQEARRLKAARGDLYSSVAIGYVRSADDRLEIDPDKRVREALHLAFSKFAEFGSVRQVAIWLCDDGIKMPIVVYR